MALEHVSVNGFLQGRPYMTDGALTAFDAALTADGTGKSLWAKIKGTNLDSTNASSGMLLTADGSGGVLEQNLSAGSSYFHSLNVRFQRRFSGGLTFTANVHASFFDVDVPVSCYPSPSPTLTVTTVG